MHALIPAGRADAVAALAIAVLILAVGGCGARAGARERYPALARFEGREIEHVRFVNPEPLSVDTLSSLIETQPSRCTFLALPICIPFTSIGREEHFLDLETLASDVERLEAYYRLRGYFGASVIPVVEPAPDDEEDVDVSFLIEPGDPVRLDTLVVTGIEIVPDPARLRRALPLESGEVFDLGLFAASADTILRELRELGHAYAEVLRSFDADTIRDRATARLDAVPGPVVRIDTIIVQGNVNLERRTVLRQLGVSVGDTLRAEALVTSQRNLYDLDIIEIAAVNIAPDSLQATPDDLSSATVLVQIAEGPVHVVEAAVGYGSVDCFRTRARWVSRNFRGGARRLELFGSVSKIGIGDPLDAGFAGSICRAFEGDPFGDVLDYRLSADLTQPYFLGPRNNLAVSLYAERQSEPSVFQRRAEGATFAVARRFDPREVLTLTLQFERRRTLASPAVFCVAFLVCGPEDVAALNAPRLTNTVGLNWYRNRTDVLLDPTRGYLLRAALVNAAQWLGSEVDYVRGTLETVVYRPVRPRTIFAAALRVGTFFGTASFEPGGDFIPPEDRFYAGGANSVRGYRRNELGPGIYVEEGPQFDPDAVEFVPIGGTSVVVATLELRFPSPFARDNLRLATFVDAGSVQRESISGMDGDEFRITPGVGLRLVTPVGPVRVDVAYNPYGPTTGPLYLIEPETGVLVRVADEFTPERGSFLSRFRVHLAVGQPF